MHLQVGFFRVNDIFNVKNIYIYISKFVLKDKHYFMKKYNVTKDFIKAESCAGTEYFYFNYFHFQKNTTKMHISENKQTKKKS